MSRTKVWAHQQRFTAAVAQLPDRLERATTPAGAVCVIDAATEGVDGVRRLLEAGPAAVVLTHPAHASRAAMELLTDAAAPVVVDRPFLRPDDVEAARGVAVRHVLVDVVSGPADFRAALLDGIGWLRFLAGAPVSVVSADRTPDAVLAEVVGHGGLTAVLTATRQDTSIAPALSVDGLGATRLEVEIDAVAGIRRSSIHDADGVLTRPGRYEARERLALRRALDAIAGAACDDLAELNHDAGIAELILGVPDRGALL
ncbi:hypothetical protein ACFUTX_13405 [Microbacterium sp. NPDC057407]|uniref:hypothetical protein n=1 Tax=Microbacterium sp. NPDC057407 TaxID=3346120 RepID=UPI003672B769